MFLAMGAFVLQVALISVSRVKAAAGAMPMPSVMLGGSLHFHDQLAGHVHSHADDDAEGHVHDGPDHDDEGTPSVLWDMFGPSIASPQAIHLLSSFKVLGSVEFPFARAIVGVSPEALIRPPSTFSIA